MAVKIRKIRGKYCLVIHDHGKRKKRVIGTDRKVAEEVKRKVGAKLALGELGILETEQQQKVPTFVAYAETWIRDYAWIECKRISLRLLPNRHLLTNRPVFVCCISGCI